MSLGIYTSANPNTSISEDGDHTSDFLASFNGRLGGVQEKQIFVRNDASDKYYENIALSMFSDETGSVYFDGSIGYVWKLYAGAVVPNELQWQAILPNNSISLADLGNNLLADTSTYLPVWVRIEVPKNQPVQTILDIRFKLNADEFIII
jgi:hypothetical protein